MKEVIINNQIFKKCVLMKTHLVKSAFCYQGEKDENFNPHFKFFTLITHFSQILDLSFHPNSRIWDMGLGKELLEINDCINNKDWKYVNLLMPTLWTCKINLSYIKKNNQNVFRSLRNEIIYKSKTISNFRGKVVFELAMAKLFSEKEINYVKSETPDFLINNSIGFECTSAQIKNVSFNKPKKLKEIIDKKTTNKEKYYSDLKSILGVDISNISGSLSNHKMLNRETINNLFEEYFKSWDSIILYSWNHYQEEQVSEFQTSRYDSPEISEEVKIFLDRIYPFSIENKIQKIRKTTYLVSKLYDEQII